MVESLFSMHETQGLSSRSKPKKNSNSKNSGINENSFKNYFFIGREECASRGQRNSWEQVLSFYHVVLRDQAHVIRLSSKYLYSLLHLDGESFFFLLHALIYSSQ